MLPAAGVMILVALCFCLRDAARGSSVFLTWFFPGLPFCFAFSVPHFDFLRALWAPWLLSLASVSIVHLAVFFTCLFLCSPAGPKGEGLWKAKEIFLCLGVDVF